MDNKYDVFYDDNGDLIAIDTDNGEKFFVQLLIEMYMKDVSNGNMEEASLPVEYRFINSSGNDAPPYEIYEEDGELKAVHLDTAKTYSVKLEKYNGS
jgi:hypothetical protein